MGSPLKLVAPSSIRCSQERIVGPGPTVVDGMLYVTSGYAQWGGKFGNVLLAFGLAD
jgi:hypothetical protein